MFGIPSVAMVVLAKAGLYLARKQKWLPKNFYHRLSLDSMRAGDFDAAAEYNALARQKDPQYEKAQVVHDLLRMNQDAHFEEIRAKAERHMLAIGRLRIEKKAMLNQLRTLRRHKIALKWRGIVIAVLLLVLSSFALICGIRFHFKDYLWLAPALTSGVLIFFLGQRAIGNARELILNEEKQIQEIRSSLRELFRETQHHRLRLRILGEKMAKVHTKAV